MTRIAFLDSNVYLHYQPVDQIDWLGLLKADAVTIIVPPVTIRELNTLKDLRARSRARRRAGEVLKRLWGLFESESEACIREHVTVRLEDRDPNIDFAEYDLVREVRDDCLIAAIIMCQAETPDAEITLITSDAGVGLLGKARRLGISVLRLSDDLRLAVEPDPAEERVKALQQELNDLKRKMPQLSLTFPDGSQCARFELPPPKLLTQEELESNLADIKQSYPKLGGQPKPSADVTELVRSMAETSAIRLTMGTVSPEDIDNYNALLEQYYTRYAEYLQRDLEYRNLQGRTIALRILLVNDGTAPANDIDVSMRFPDGLYLSTESDYPAPPSPPESPSKPKTPLEQFLQRDWAAQRILQPLSRYALDSVVRPRDVSPPNVSQPRITRTDSFEVEVDVVRIKHKTPLACLSALVAFDSFDTAQSFHTDYSLLADNVPQQITGQLHIIIQKG